MTQPVSGHVFLYEGKRRPTWRAKYRLPDGRQVQKTLGPAWTARGRPPAGYFTKRTAEAWLRQTLAEAAAGTLVGIVRTGATVADACAEYLRYIEQDREDLTPARVERWAAHETDPERRMANRTREKTITVFHGAMDRARKLHRLSSNPVAEVEKPRTASTTATSPARRSASGPVIRMVT
jgi:hypothetical protein